MCDFILGNLRVIKQVSPSVGMMLDNCRVWAGRINDNELALCYCGPICGCAAFQWLPRRHGHVVCLSWDYTSLYAIVDTISVKTKAKILPGWRQQDMKISVANACLKWLPDSLMTDLRGLDLLYDPLPTGRHCFSLGRWLGVKSVWLLWW